MWPLLAGGAALGGLKFLEDRNRADKQRKAQADIQRYSPWTGLQGQVVQDPSLLGNLATGAAVGSMASNMFPGGQGSTGKEFMASNATSAPAQFDMGSSFRQGFGGSAGAMGNPWANPNLLKDPMSMYRIEGIYGNNM